MDKILSKISYLISIIKKREDRKIFFIGLALFVLGLVIIGSAPFFGLLLSIGSVIYCIWRYKNSDKVMALDKDLHEKSSNVIRQVKSKATEIKQSETVQNTIDTAKDKGKSLWSRRWFKLALGCVALVLVGFWIFGGSSDYESSYDHDSSKEDYSWIVGTWACNMGGYGTVVLKFDGDGSSGDCTEVEYGSYKYGTYHVSGNTLSYKLNGESFTTTIEIQSGHRLHAGEGCYYHKR